MALNIILGHDWTVHRFPVLQFPVTMVRPRPGLKLRVHGQALTMGQETRLPPMNDEQPCPFHG